MKRAYWEKLASSYQQEIFDVLQQDHQGLLKKEITKYANPTHHIIDIGCAIGKWIPVLSPQFKKITALDISAENLRIAKETYSHLSNIEYLRADMSSSRIHLPLFDMGICINALLTPEAKDRKIFFKNLSNCIAKGGILILTVPSLESFLLTKLLQKEFTIDAPLFPELKNKAQGLRNWNKIVAGVGDIDQVPHKHFLREELILLLDRYGFQTLLLQKIEYSWKTEFHRPPRWMQSPRPWDWMIVVQRKS